LISALSLFALAPDALLNFKKIWIAKRMSKNPQTIKSFSTEIFISHSCLCTAEDVPNTIKRLLSII
jgi:hypothetical protein